MQQQLVTEVIEQMSNSQVQLSRMLEAERDVTLRMAELVKSLPDAQPNFGDLEGLMEHAQMLTQSITSYLMGLADLQETLAAQIGQVMRELRPAEDEEE